MKAVSRYIEPAGQSDHYRLARRCRVCDKKVTDLAYYCHQHSHLRRTLNRQLRRWERLEDELERGLITSDEAKVIRVWP